MNEDHEPRQPLFERFGILIMFASGIGMSALFWFAILRLISAS